MLMETLWLVLKKPLSISCFDIVSALVWLNSLFFKNKEEEISLSYISIYFSRLLIKSFVWNSVLSLNKISYGISVTCFLDIETLCFWSFRACKNKLNICRPCMSFVNINSKLCFVFLIPDIFVIRLLKQSFFLLMFFMKFFIYK